MKPNNFKTENGLIVQVYEAVLSIVNFVFTYYAVNGRWAAGGKNTTAKANRQRG